MKKGYLGIDIGSTTIKGVIIDESNNVIASIYKYIKDDIIVLTKTIIEELIKQIEYKNYKIVSFGITGINRKIIKKIFDASTIKNEVVSNAVGTINYYKNARTIIEIGGTDAKIISLNKGKIIDYDMNDIYTSQIGIYLDNHKNDYDFKNFKRTNKCIYLGEKLQNENIYNIIVNNYLNSLAKNKKIIPPIIFNGGASKNKHLQEAFSEILNEDIIILNNSHLINAIGVAILSKEEKEIDFDMDKINHKLNHLYLHKN